MQGRERSFFGRSGEWPEVPLLGSGDGNAGLYLKADTQQHPSSQTASRSRPAFRPHSLWKSRTALRGWPLPRVSQAACPKLTRVSGGGGGGLSAHSGTTHCNSLWADSHERLTTATVCRFDQVSSETSLLQSPGRNFPLLTSDRPASP